MYNEGAIIGRLIRERIDENLSKIIIIYNKANGKKVSVGKKIMCESEG